MATQLRASVAAAEAAPPDPAAAPAAPPPAPAPDTHEAPDPHEAIADYEPVALRRQRHDGWTAERQRAFLVGLAETGCISEACRLSGLTARSAYRLRAHKLGGRFADAWDQALRYATARLMTLAYERAIRGVIRETWRDGKLVGESRAPSDRLLIFLLSQLVPWQAGPESRWAKVMQASGDAAGDLAPVLGKLEDCAVPCDALSDADFLAQPIATTDPRVQPFNMDWSEKDRWG